MKRTRSLVTALAVIGTACIGVNPMLEFEAGTLEIRINSKGRITSLYPQPRHAVSTSGGTPSAVPR